MKRRRFIGIAGLVAGLGATITGCKRDSEIDGWQRSSVDDAPVWSIIRSDESMAPMSEDFLNKDPMLQFEEHLRILQREHLRYMKYGKSFGRIRYETT